MLFVHFVQCISHSDHSAQVGARIILLLDLFSVHDCMTQTGSCQI